MRAVVADRVLAVHDERRAILQSMGAGVEPRPVLTRDERRLPRRRIDQVRNRVRERNGVTAAIGVTAATGAIDEPTSSVTSTPLRGTQLIWTVKAN